MRIIRHELEIRDYQTIALPSQGDLLSVAKSRTDENHNIDMWSLDYEYGACRDAAVYIVGTGNPMPPQLRDSAQVRFDKQYADEVFRPAVMVSDAGPVPWRKFIGSVVTPIGLVWHVFEGPVQ